MSEFWFSVSLVFAVAWLTVWIENEDLKRRLAARKARRPWSHYHIYAPGMEESVPDECTCRWYRPGLVVSGDAGETRALGWTRCEDNECPVHASTP